MNLLQLLDDKYTAEDKTTIAIHDLNLQILKSLDPGTSSSLLDLFPVLYNIPGLFTDAHDTIKDVRKLHEKYVFQRIEEARENFDVHNMRGVLDQFLLSQNQELRQKGQTYITDEGIAGLVIDVIFAGIEIYKQYCWKCAKTWAGNSVNNCYFGCNVAAIAQPQSPYRAGEVCSLDAHRGSIPSLHGPVTSGNYKVWGSQWLLTVTKLQNTTAYISPYIFSFLMYYLITQHMQAYVRSRNVSYLLLSVCLQIFMLNYRSIDNIRNTVSLSVWTGTPSRDTTQNTNRDRWKLLIEWCDWSIWQGELANFRSILSGNQ